MVSALITSLLGAAAKRTTAAILEPASYDGGESPLQQTMILQSSNDAPETFIMDSRQEQCVAATLSSPEFDRLLQTYILTKITLHNEDVTAHEDSFIGALENLLQFEFKEQRHFAHEIAQWLWPSIMEYVRHIGSEHVSSNMKGFLVSRRSNDAASDVLAGENPLPMYVRNFLSAISGVDRINSVRNAAYDIRSEICSSHHMMNMDHLLEGDYRVDKKDIFIHRTLHERGQSNRAIETTDLPIGRNSIGRVVVLGDPGVGKTTLMSHIVAEIASTDNGMRVPILVTCRNFTPDAKFDMDQWVSGDFRVVRSLGVEHGAIKDLLATGQAVVLFDGLDEVIDTARRSRLVAEIEAFCRRYPLCPIVATARRVGYERNALKENFRVYSLQEFSDAQVREYAGRWFTKRGSPETTRRFLANSETIRDIRANPLMLSLLCDVYRARGYLPRNRFEVYGNCAELLFTRWDSMREIESPPDHMRYGARLFEELAWFFHSSQSARSGVEERQLVQIISEFFRRNAGVDPGEAPGRARRFLDFCADRAWLLSSQYTNERGARVFSFTHRTFLEFYAAQAIVKRSSGLDQIVAAIRSAYHYDPGSVLCDLIMQYYDNTKYDGGADILLELLSPPFNETNLSAEARLSLCLRLADAIALPSHVLDKLVLAIWEVWTVLPPEETFNSSFALFSLNRDARNRVVQHAISAAGPPPNRQDGGNSATPLLESLVHRWAWLDCLGQTSLADEGWGETISDWILSRHEIQPWESGAVLTYIYRHLPASSVQLSDLRPADLIALSCFGTGAPGLLTDSLFSPPLFPQCSLTEDEIDACLDLSKAASRRVSSSKARLMTSAVEAGEYVTFSSPARSILYWFSFVSFESSRTTSLFEEIEERTFPVALLAEIFDHRSAEEGDPRVEGEAPHSSDEVIAAVKELLIKASDKRWISQWVRGESFLVQ